MLKRVQRSKRHTADALRYLQCSVVGKTPSLLPVMCPWAHHTEALHCCTSCVQDNFACDLRKTVTCCTNLKVIGTETVRVAMTCAGTCRSACHILRHTTREMHNMCRPVNTAAAPMQTTPLQQWEQDMTTELGAAMQSEVSRHACGLLAVGQQDHIIFLYKN